MHDESPLIRQWILLRTLATRRYGVTVKELAREAGVSLKTIRRDLEAFQAAGFPLREIVGDFGRKKWHLESPQLPAELSFTWDEAAALYLGRRLLEPLIGTMFWQAAREAFRKIQAVLEPVPREYLDKFASLFGQTMIGTHDYSKKADLIDLLMQASEDNRTVAMTYQSLAATEPVTETDPPARRQPARRVHAGRHGGNQTLDPELRQRGPGARTRSTAIGTDRRTNRRPGRPQRTTPAAEAAKTRRGEKRRTVSGPSGVCW
jgi:hypothetical protein